MVAMTDLLHEVAPAVESFVGFGAPFHRGRSWGKKGVCMDKYTYVSMLDIQLKMIP